MAPDAATLDEAKSRYARVAGRLRAYPNVVGVGVGLREIGNRATDEVAIRVYVRRKLPRALLRADDLLPDSIDDVRIDVNEATFTLGASPTVPADHQAWQPVLRGGVVITNPTTRGAGTLGVTVFDNQTGEQLLLSNFHVLCHPDGCVPGETVYQPAANFTTSQPSVTLKSGDVVARVQRGALTDRVDAAVARLTGHRFLLAELLGVGPIRGARPPRCGQRVRKAGMRTGAEELQVVDVHLSTTVGDKSKIFADHAVQGQVSAKGAVTQERDGDSGSVLVDDDGYVVALAWSGGLTDRVNANPIDAVLSTLDVHLDVGRALALHDFATVIEAQ